LIFGIKCIHLIVVKASYVFFCHHLITIIIAMCLLFVFLWIGDLSELIGMFGANTDLLRSFED